MIWKDVVRIIDDQDSVRDALSFLLEGADWNTRQYASAEAFLEAKDFTDPGCIILDVLMPGGISGLVLQKKLQQMECDLPIIFLSAHGDIEMAVKTVLQGASNFLTKPVNSHQLFEAVKKAVKDCHEKRREKLEKQSVDRNLDSLTQREAEVARLLAQGLPNKVVAAQLNIAERTVQVHRASIYLKLGVHSAAEIALLLK